MIRQYHNVINQLRAHIRMALCDLEAEFSFPKRSRGHSLRARCLTEWFAGTSKVHLLTYIVIRSLCIKRRLRYS